MAKRKTQRRTAESTVPLEKSHAESKSHSESKIDGPPAIDIERVSIERDGRRVVDEVSLAVEPGTIHLVIGPNGAGKSTLLSAVLGQTAFTGQIRTSFRGNGIVGYVPQTFVADRTLPITIAEFLALQRQKWPVCLGITRSARTRIGEVLERVGLAGMERRRIGELSGGELRRVLIGNAIEPAPELLLCDEPATGLDPEAVVELDETLSELRRAHRTTVLMVSHDRGQIRRIADRVTLLHVKVKRTGTAEEVLGDSASEGALS